MSNVTSAPRAAPRPNAYLSALSLIKPDLELVNEEIRRRMQSPVRMISEVAAHTLSAGGKRLRPALTILSARCVGSVNPRVITLAAVVELTHTATLIHDDIIDHAEFRRGRPAANALWGSHVSVLVGDYFFSQVFEAMSEDGLSTLMPAFSRATAALCRGEIEEIELRGNYQAKEQDYLQVIEDKTARLMSAAAELGALAGGGNAQHAKRLGDYGLNIGMAFQIVDDILDITSNSEQLGKPVGHDLLEGSLTLPIIRTMQVASEGERSRIQQLLRHCNENGSSADPVLEVLGAVNQYDGVSYARRLAEQYTERARAALETIPCNPASEILHSVCDYVLAREA